MKCIVGDGRVDVHLNGLVAPKLVVFSTVGFVKHQKVEWSYDAFCDKNRGILFQVPLRLRTFLSKQVGGHNVHFQ